MDYDKENFDRQIFGDKELYSFHDVFRHLVYVVAFFRVAVGVCLFRIEAFRIEVFRIEVFRIELFRVKKADFGH